MLNLLARMATDEALIGQVLGAAALFCACASPLCRQRQTILLVQAAGSATLALYFASFSAGTAAITSAISLVQLGIAALVRQRAQMTVAYVATIPASVWLIADSWDGIPSALATLGAILCSAARLQRAEMPMMILFLCAASFWAAHNFWTGSTFGLALDAVSVAGTIAGLLNLLRITPPQHEIYGPALSPK